MVRLARKHTEALLHCKRAIYWRATALATAKSTPVNLCIAYHFSHVTIDTKETSWALFVYCPKHGTKCSRICIIVKRYCDIHYKLHQKLMNMLKAK